MTIKTIFYTILVFFILNIPTNAQDRALLIGIDKYQNASQLVGSKQDAKDMQQFIKSVWGYQNHQIRILTDAQATRQAILNAFDNWLIKGSRRGDKILFYFSGHGSHTTDRNGDESDGYDEFLLPVDFPRMITDDEINARLRRLKGRQVMVVIDACHSGTITRSIANPTIKVPVFSHLPKLTRGVHIKPYIQRDGFIATQQNIIAYSAVAPNQVALVDVEKKPYRGVFTSRFIEGIKNKRADNNKDGKVTHAELLDYIRQKSQAYCDRRSWQCRLGNLSPQLETKSEILTADISTWKVSTDNNKANLQISVLPNSRLKLGKSMKIRIRSNKSGYLLLFEINSIGDLMRLFPKDNKPRYIKAGSTLTIPDRFYGFQFITGEPIGKGSLIAILIEDNISKYQNLIPNAFTQIPAKQATATLQQLTQQLNRSARWSLKTIDYEIVR
jgi:hypothetical protein